MNSQLLKETVKLLFADNKGLLAMDESNGTCNKRFEKLGIPQTVEARRAYRELIVTAPGLSESIGGAILYDETIRQQKSDGTPFVKVLVEAGITPGIKVDTGAKELAGHPGEKVTEGLDGLRDRLHEYFEMGARFADCNAFVLWRVRGQDQFTVGATEEPRVLVGIEGSGQIMHDGIPYAVGKGDVWLLPAEVGECAFEPSGEVTMLEIAIP